MSGRKKIVGQFIFKYFYSSFVPICYETTIGIINKLSAYDDIRYYRL